jgi:broad specificity phosphatase PhoE
MLSFLRLSDILTNCACLWSPRFKSRCSGNAGYGQTPTDFVKSQSTTTTMVRLVLGAVAVSVLALPVGQGLSFGHLRPSNPSPCINRRDTLLGTIGTAVWVPSAVYAVSDDDALTDLPTIDPKTTKRVFMCRHGETEYNRLKKVQGARVDAPLNETGQRQAQSLGQALSRVRPGHLYYSSLLRAKETASIAARQMSSSPDLVCLPSLKEIDFGDAVEGASVSTYRAQITATYAAWSMGQLDARIAQDGENLAQVQHRVWAATQSMLNGNASVIAAVSHSSYLRVFLSTVDTGFSMVQASYLQIPNCAIHVVDFDKREDSAQSPYGRVVRTSETRHLILI